MREIRLLVDGPARGPWNMATDEALMESARRGVVTLRLYAFRPPCLSFGRNQAVRGRYDVGAAAARGIELVRRPTGGRAVYHHRELTYALIAPDRAWGGPRAAFARIHRALGRGLVALGAPVALASGRPEGPAAPGPDPGGCFRAPAPGELVACGRKLVGSAVWRRAGALLQHGSVLIEDEQGVAEELALAEGAPGSGGRPAAAPRAAIGLAEACGRVPSAGEVAEAVVAGFEEELGVRARAAAATRAERSAARRLTRVYAGPEWTWRR